MTSQSAPVATGGSSNSSSSSGTIPADNAWAETRTQTNTIPEDNAWASTRTQTETIPADNAWASTRTTTAVNEEPEYDLEPAPNAVSSAQVDWSIYEPQVNDFADSFSGSYDMDWQAAKNAGWATLELFNDCAMPTLSAVIVLSNVAGMVTAETPPGAVVYLFSAAIMAQMDISSADEFSQCGLTVMEISQLVYGYVFPNQ